jgi:hypothetical protein
MFSRSSTTWHVLFTVFNGSTGIIIFIMFAYGRVLAFCRHRRGLDKSTAEQEETDSTKAAATMSNSKLSFSE